MNKKYQPSILYRLYASFADIPQFADEIFISGDVVAISYKGSTETFTVNEQSSISTDDGIFFPDITFNSRNGYLTVKGFGTSTASEIQNEIGARIKKHISEIERQERIAREKAEREARIKQEIEELLSYSPGFQDSFKKLQDTRTFDQYISNKHYSYAEELLKPYLNLISKIDKKSYLVDISKEYKKITNTILPLLENYQFDSKHLKSYNSKFIEGELRSFKTYFDNVESNPLTARQSEACVISEDANLVVAGAGTGKTSTIVGKCGYLIKKNLLKPSEVLLLAYGKKASIEMDERIAEKVGNIGIKASTFHSLGLSIIGEVEGEKPILANFASDEYERGEFFKTLQDKIIESNPSYREKLLEFFAYYLVEQKSEFDFKTAKEYFDYIKSEKFITLKGNKVRSYSELVIANELFLNGIPYEYEKNYEYSTATAYKRNYQPDFYLSDLNVYLEFYGIDRQNKTAPFVDQAKYNAGIAWKRQLHQENGTKCLELFYYQMKEGRLLNELWEHLKSEGVKKCKIDVEKAVKELNSKNTFDGFSDLLSDFTKLFKQEGSSISALKNRSKGNKRISFFLSIFEDIYDEYEKDLKARKRIDFEDMIIKATQYTNEGKYAVPYKFVLVDEYQDISRSRANLVKALIAQKKLSKVFCVGDDWQSIYRFSGSDISLMTKFKDQFGYHVQTDLDKTFRYNSVILNISNKFVMLNNELIKKELQAHKTATDKRAEIFYYSKKDPDNLQVKKVAACLDIISRKAKTDGVDNPLVYLIGRYNFSLEKEDFVELRNQFPKLKVDFITAHSSKGKEADYVIILGMENLRSGFPNRKQNDEIIELVLPRSESFPDAEEARLFYVAVTRARHRVYIMAHREYPSSFVETIQKYNEWVDDAPNDDFKALKDKCPQCKDGHLVIRNGANGNFVSCTLYPVCDHTEKACEKCGKGIFQDIDSKTKKCSNNSCGHTISKCPSCGEGIQVFQNGRNGNFFGCSRYPECDFTEQACERCGKGQYIQVNNSISRCNIKSCGHEIRVCPRCHNGILLKKNGKYGPFLGCSNYKGRAVVCRYTESA